MKNNMLFMLLAAYFLVVSFKKENNIINTAPVMIRVTDTIISPVDIKLKIAKKIKDSINLLTKNTLTSASDNSIGDPDDGTIPITSTKVIATDTSVRAEAQMKAYLDSLIIDPKSGDLMRDEKMAIEREINEASAGQRISRETLWKETLLLVGR